MTSSCSVEHVSVLFWVHYVLVWTVEEVLRLASVHWLVYKVVCEKGLSSLVLLVSWIHVYQVLFSAYINCSFNIWVSLNQALQLLITVFELSGSSSSHLLLASISVLKLSFIPTLLINLSRWLVDTIYVWKLVMSMPHLHKVLLLLNALLAVAWMCIVTHQRICKSVMTLSCKSKRVHHLWRHKSSTHERIREREWIVLTWCQRLSITLRATNLALALSCWRWRFLWCFLAFEAFLFLFLLINNDIIGYVVDKKSAISCYRLRNSLSIKTTDLWLWFLEIHFLCLFWRLIAHLLVAFNWVVKPLIFRNHSIIWLLVFLIFIQRLLLLFHHLLDLSLLVNHKLLIAFGSLGFFLHLVMNLEWIHRWNRWFSWSKQLCFCFNFSVRRFDLRCFKITLYFFNCRLFDSWFNVRLFLILH